MTIMVPNASEVTQLSQALGKVTPNNQIIKLYVNNYTPTATDTAASYTEMSTLGYAAKTLTMASWTVATVSGVATATYAAQTWTFTAGTLVNVYGYFVVDATSGLLLWSEAFNASKPIQFGGDQIIITPTYTLQNV